MRCQLAAIRCRKGDVAGNLAGHLRLVAKAAAAGCQLAVFPEMSLTGSVHPTGAERLIALDHPAIARLAEVSGETGVGVCFGIAERGPGGQPHITQVVAVSGRIAGVQRKRHLGEGEEAFTAAAESAVFEHAGTRFGIAICAEAGFDAPFDAAAAAGARLVLFPAAPGLHGRRDSEASWRRGFSWWEQSSLGDARRHAQRLRLWIALAGQAGATADEDFPGLAALVDPEGKVTARLPDWHPGVLTAEIPAEAGTGSRRPSSAAG
ncbi:MAG: carbon-nitrogen hydrolase family protein [Actinobacteria bacterium]|nr:carbon-nitrogen hydrolase family protein [Actinomycetota bacterium]